MSKTTGTDYVFNLSTLWFAMFVMLKVTGVQAAWSWWWLLFPVVPALAFLFEKFGWL